MRRAFASLVCTQYKPSDTFFLTGDLGFMALEEVQQVFGDHFINCGIAEQNMISVAAGLAYEGFKVFAYSIAPFIYARPFEQIRNDICALPNAHICLVGNGGGYGYGHMGATHHALEDCAAMHALGIQVIVPAFNKDIAEISQYVHLKPSYLRLGYDHTISSYTPPTFAPWRQLLPGNRGVWVVLGPLAGIALKVLTPFPEDDRPALWVCSLLTEPPEELYAALSSKGLTVFEEHVAHGGLGMFLTYYLQLRNIYIKTFEHRYALRYPSHTFGSQDFHRAESGIDANAMQSLLEKQK